MAVAVLLLVIIIYETAKDLREREQNMLDGTVLTLSAAELRGPVAGYYRSHPLPSGWKVGDTVAAGPDKIEVALYFAPDISHSRHGKAAEPGEITPANGCPADEALRHELASTELWILVNDKTGLIARFACGVATPQP